jgi:hypothetical protein
MTLHTYIVILRNRRELLVSAGSDMCAWAYVVVEWGKKPVAVRLAKPDEVKRLRAASAP